MIRIPVAVFAAAAAAGLVALSACSQKVAATPTAADQVVAEQAGEVRLAAAEVGTLGAVVTDQNGRTLYRSDKDKSKPPVSNCNAECAKSWPPVTVEDPSQVQLTGVDQKLVGTVQRADGTMQLTLAGWPLYRSAKDSRAGDFNGQGVSGSWFAATPQGKKAEATQAAPPADGGYGY